MGGAAVDVVRQRQTAVEVSRRVEVCRQAPRQRRAGPGRQFRIGWGRCVAEAGVPVGGDECARSVRRPQVGAQSGEGGHAIQADARSHPARGVGGALRSEVIRATPIGGVIRIRFAEPVLLGGRRDSAAMTSDIVKSARYWISLSETEANDVMSSLVDSGIIPKQWRQFVFIQSSGEGGD